MVILELEPSPSGSGEEIFELTGNLNAIVVSWYSHLSAITPFGQTFKVLEISVRYSILHGFHGMKMGLLGERHLAH